MRVFGKATDETLDSDDQIVDVKWAADALAKWLETGGNLRVQHNPSLYPAGVGIELEIKDDGAYLTGEVVEPTAKRLVEKGVLSAYSIGISHPKVVKDARAPGGRICGGDIVEVSLVDRPANPSCKFALAKGVGSGEWVGEITQIDEYDLKELADDEDAEKTAKPTEATETVETEPVAVTETEESAKEDQSELDKLTEAVEVIKGSRVFYSNDHKDNISKAMADLHDSLAKAFPEVCSAMDKAIEDPEIEKDLTVTHTDKCDASCTGDCADHIVADKSKGDESDDDKEDPTDEDEDKDKEDEEDDKVAEPEATKAEGEVTIEEAPETPELAFKEMKAEIKKLRKHNKKLQKQYNKLASEPDPAQAAMRGKVSSPVVQKVAQPEAQKSAVEVQEHAERVAWLQDIAMNGEPQKMSWAQERLASIGEDYV